MKQLPLISCCAECPNFRLFVPPGQSIGRAACWKFDYPREFTRDDSTHLRTPEWCPLPDAGSAQFRENRMTEYVKELALKAFEAERDFKLERERSDRAESELATTQLELRAVRDYCARVQRENGERLSEIVSDAIDPSVGVNWMRGSPDLGAYIRSLEANQNQFQWRNLSSNPHPDPGQLCLVYSRPFPIVAFFHGCGEGVWEADGSGKTQITSASTLWIPIPNPPPTFA